MGKMSLDEAGLSSKGRIFFVLTPSMSRSDVKVVINTSYILQARLPSIDLVYLALSWRIALQCILQHTRPVSFYYVVRDRKS